MDPGTIVSAISCVAEYTVAPIVKQVKYVLDYKQNMTNLPKEVEKLMDLKREIEGLVSSARENAEEIKPSVVAWVMEADLVAEAACQIIQEEEEESKKRCFISLCLNPVSRHRSSRNAFKVTVQISHLQADGREFKDGSVSVPFCVALGKDFLDFDSRSDTWEEIMKALSDPDANVIGVYGMGGVGKTTLVKQVVARAAKEKLFGEVIVPFVTRKNVLNAKKFQDEMAKVLGMKLGEQWNQWTESQRADRISTRLTGDAKRTIVILDDLRAKLDLEKVGIKGCKILFTSRFHNISYTAQEDFTIEVLREREAWTLFQRIIGDVLEDSTFLNIGKEITKNCKGLPILIVTVAGALLRRRSLGAWKDALIRLQREDSNEMQEFVDSALEYISFNHLSDGNKSLFLLCGLLGEGEISIFDQLLKLGIGRGLFKHTKTMEEARFNLETLIHNLKASFLLFDGQSVNTVRMHDVVRDVAIKIASNDKHNMLMGSSEEWPEDDVLRRCTALTFPHGIVPELPDCLESPSLQFLLLYHNHSSLKISDNLFEKMQKLTVLDIRSVDLVPTLPSSLVFLINLNTLSLNSCKLKDISVVGELKKLKVLSLNNTGIIVLPMEIGNLTELRLLDLNGCSQLKVIPPGIIKCLSRLEELHMARSFSQWEIESLASSERRNASLDELSCLVGLTTLRIHIQDANLVPKYFEKLETFTIILGYEKWDWSCHRESLFLSHLPQLQNLCGVMFMGESSFSKLKYVNVNRCNSLRNLFSFSMARSLLHLEEVKVTDCDSLEAIVGDTREDGKNGDTVVMDELEFPQLRSLILERLPKLARFYSGSSIVFPTLALLSIRDCPEFKTFVGTMTEKNFSTAMEPFFNDKVQFPSLTEIKLGNSDNTKTSPLTKGKMEFEGDEEDKDLNTIIKVSKTGTVTKLGKKSEISTVTIEQGRIAETFEDVAKCSNQEVSETNDKAIKSFVETESYEDVVKCSEEEAQRLAIATSSLQNHSEPEAQICENSTNPSKNGEIYENSNEPGTKTEMWENVTESREMVEICAVIVKQDMKAEICEENVTQLQGEAQTCEDAEKHNKEISEMNDKDNKSSMEAESSDKAIESQMNDNGAINSRKEAYEVDDERVEIKKEGEFYEEIVERREEIDTCKEIDNARNEAETLPRPYLVKEPQEFVTPTPDAVDVACLSSQSHPALGSGIGETTCKQNNDFQGLQVTRHLIPLLEKARDKHGEFHNSPLIKSKTVGIAAMESVGQILHILQTQPPRSIDGEKIRFMEEAFHDVSNMSFPIEWLRPLIDKASKCIQRKEKIDEMEAQIQALKRG